MQTLSQLLSQALGLFMTIIGLAFLFRSGYFIKRFKEFFKNHQLRIIFVVLELLGGLFLVLGHESNLSPVPIYARLITIFGWAMVLESLFNLFASDETIEKFYGKFMEKNWFVGFSIASIILGVFLAGSGFGFF
jgi:hypothetical protein